jgi:hypothetical protein
MRKTSSYLNGLRLDVNKIQFEIDHTGCNIEEAANKLGKFSAHDLVTNDSEFKEAFNTLVKEHNAMGNLLTSFRKARASYLEFF